ncbi:NAD(P)-dependent oxidoreductase (plasmid) [Rhizobium lusitanum]|uniref:NAD-dependent epimerase/dehydratase family protein n=1 Tax=Rhizobium lusitanum TaxID=293958 RepID=UPI0016181CD1|nr:NAD(P)-dependent oxidoreductase [Rhizobium lusitanum]QND45958.1 NAD(P)-dependent oxidoreductase [Rhizobium lusitanum]
MRSFTQAGWVVTAADLAPNIGYIRRFGRADCPIHSVDVTDAGMVRALFDHAGVCDAVVFAAGLTGQRTQTDPSLATDILLKGTESIAAAMRATGIPRLVGVSSLAVYATGRNSSEPLCEAENPTGQVGVYGSVIRRMEAAMIALEGLSVGLARAAGVYGPNRYGHGSQSSQLIERLLYSAALKQPINLQGYWQDCDDFIYARDLGDALEGLARPGHPEGCEIINVGTGTTASLRELIEAIEQSIGPIDVNLVAPDPPRAPLARPPLDTARMLKRIGPPKFTLKEAMRDFAREVDLLIAQEA